MSQVAAELGISQTGLNLNHGWVRALAGQNSGTVSMNNLQGQTAQPNWNANPGSGPTFGFNFSVPFFRGTTATAGQSGTNPLPVSLTFSAAPNWSGNILIRNNSTGASQVLNQQNSTTWGSSSGPLNLFRANTTDNFSLFPST
jgi:hypothetical protein